MSRATWTSSAVSSDLEHYERNVFRFADPEGARAILDLVDTATEVDILENVLYKNREKFQEISPSIHRLLARPFELSDPAYPSRFRNGYEPGVLYSAESIKTAALERGYHKVRLLRESPELGNSLVHNQTLINFDILTSAIDIRITPYSKHSSDFLSTSSYKYCQEFALIARSAGAGVIVYKSARGAGDGPCIAILSIDALKSGQPKYLNSGWDIRVTRERATWINSDTSEKLEFEY